MPNELTVIQDPRERRGVSDEDHEAYYEGVRAACDAMRGDAVYYGPVNAKPGLASNVRAVADFIEASI